MNRQCMLALVGLAALVSARSVVDPLPLAPGEDKNGLCAQKQCPQGYSCKLLPNIDCKQNCELFAQCIPPNVILNGTSNVNTSGAPCGSNEERKVCGSACEPSCSQQEPRPCSMQCIPNVCQCKVGFYRNNNNQCVRRNECPSTGGPMNPVLTCATMLCQPGFACKQETINCIRAPCPQPRPRCVPSNSTINPCASMTCPTGQTCQLKQVQCIRAPCDPIGECVNENNNGNGNLTCGVNEHVDQCGGCDSTCTDRMRMCPMICRQPACACKVGFLRHNGVCITADQCPASSNKTCGANEEFLNCGTACEPSCSNQRPLVCTEQCIVNVCQCKKDFYRSQSGACVPLDKCDANTIPLITCANFRCTNGTECKMVDVLCKKAPCPQYPECVPISPVGSSCALVDCKSGYRCEETPIPCLVAPCPTKASCVPIESDTGHSKCEVIDCPPNKRCVDEPLPCLVPPCPVAGRCIDATCGQNETFSTCSGCDPNCDNMEMICPAVCGPAKCECKPGFVRNPKTGTCINRFDCPRNSSVPSVCLYTKCTADTECVEEPIPCLIAPCPTRARCVPRSKCNLTCDAGFECDIYNGKETCAPIPGYQCAATTCLPGTNCVEEPMPCLVAPCPTQAKCVNATGGVTCANVRIKCSEGEQCGMVNGAPTCVPVPGYKCASTSCLAGTSCVEEPMPCLLPPCPVQAKCINNTATCLTVKLKCPEGQQCGIQNGFPTCVPVCPANQTWMECAGCDEQCGKPLQLCTAACKPSACQCSLGFVRDVSGKNCVAKEDCFKNATTNSNCALIDCKSGFRCVEKPSPCLIPPCPTTASCIPDVPSTNKTCVADCPPGTTCILQTVNCFTTPCEPIPRCVRFEDDVSNKKCEVMDCPTGMRCIDEALPCLVPPCPVAGRCASAEDVLAGCGRNETVARCSGCEAQCGTVEKICAAVCGPPKCECKPGFSRHNATGKCMQFSECPRNASNNSTCHSMSCMNGTVCIEESVQCFVPPCPSQPRCVRQTAGQICAATTCLQGTICVEEPIPCLVAPCPLQAKCVNATAGGPTCASIRMKCSEGHQCGMVNGSATCVPIPGYKCAATSCRPGTTCVEEPIPCIVGPCLIQAKCVNASAGATCDTVRMKCPVGQQCGIKNGSPACVPGCPVNQTWTECRGCEEQCGKPLQLCTAACKPSGCQCSPGFIRDRSGVNCIAAKECALNGNSTTTVPPYSCANIKCKSGQKCIMQVGSPVCVPISSPTCPTNEIWEVCGGCEGTCKNPSPVCGLDCKKAACVCAPGMVRNNGICVTFDKCDVKDLPKSEHGCEPNEEYTDCKPQCEDDCSGHACYQNSQNVSTTVCVPGCVCKPYYKRGAYGTCTHSRLCYKDPGCSWTEEWSQCLPCESKCSDDVRSNHTCTKQCRSGCACAPGFARNSNGYCVDEDFGCMFSFILS